MKKNRIFGLASAITLLLAGGCSNDVIDSGAQNVQQGTEVPEDGTYITVNFDLPSAKETRSFTNGDNSSNGGQEIGHDFENKVSEAYIVLARKDNSFIAAAQTTTLEAIGVSGRSYRNTTVFSKTDLARYYQDLNSFDKDEQNFNVINVFVFANPTKGLQEVLEAAEAGDTEWINKVGVYDTSINEGVIWDKDHFLMTNSEIATRRVPATLDDWNDHTTASTAFDLSGMNNYGRPNEIDNLTSGNIMVERAAARYDFRDGALDGINNEDQSYNGFKAQTYHVVRDADNHPLVDVFLGKMSMVNMNKEYYFIRRVSPTGLDANWQICGIELPWYSNADGKWKTDEDGGQINGNYVVDAMADWKHIVNNAGPSTGFDLHFNYPFFNAYGEVDNIEASLPDGSDRWYTSKISDVLTNGEKDNPDSWNQNGTKPQYRTWRYLTEGTIPGVQSQKNGVSNGVVFKGQLQPARDIDANNDDYFTQKLLTELNVVSGEDGGNGLTDPIIYVYANHMYCTWEHVRRVAIRQALTSMSYNSNDGKWSFNINRSSPLYYAAFGKGGFGTVTFKCDVTGVPEGGTVDLDNADFLINPALQPSEVDGVRNDIFVLEDNLAEATDCPDYLWKKWKEIDPDTDEEFEESEAFYAFRDAAVNYGEDGNEKDPNIGKFTLYQTSFDPDLGGWGYYCYYYYWNRHNDNGQPGVMGPMEFAVVRNNVYKLAVTKISRIGHPRIGANDPDKPTPNTDDELNDVYITVTCTTLPWVVRENEIQF